MDERNIFENAQCIWLSDEVQVNQYALFEQKFCLYSSQKNVVLRICAENRYLLFINGIVFLQAQSFAAYPFYRVYDEVILPTEYLTEGENLLRILVYYQNEDSLTCYPAEHGVIFEILENDAVIAFSGTEQTYVYETTGYRNGPMERLTFQLSFGFAYNAVLMKDFGIPKTEAKRPIQVKKSDCYHKRPIPQLVVGKRQEVCVLSQGLFTEYRTIRKDDFNKGNVHNVGEAEGLYLTGDRMQYAAMRFLDWNRLCLNGKKVLSENSEAAMLYTQECGDGIYLLLDLQKEQAGYLELDLSVEQETDILIGFGEHLRDLRVRTSVGRRQFAVSYHAAKGKNRFLHTMKRIAGRYLQVHIFTKKVSISYIGIRSADYPVTLKAKPVMNVLQEKIYDVCVETLKRCMHEHYEDCPWREQALFAMDARNQMLCSYELFGETRLAAASLKLLGLSQRSDGFLELCAPARNTSVIPSFCLMWVVSLAEYAKETMDTKLVGEILPVAERIIKAFLRYEKDGLIQNPDGYWNFYEWMPLLDGKDIRNGADAPLNAFFVWALQSMTELLGLLKQESKAAEWKVLSGKIRHRYQETFYCEEKKAYRLSDVDSGKDVFPELVQALTVVSGLCSDKNVEEGLCSRLLTDAFWPRISLSHLTFSYEALLKRTENHARILTDIEKRWGNMLFQGAVTFWETDQGAEDFGGAGSLCHGWSAMPAYYFSKLLREK